MPATPRPINLGSSFRVNDFCEVCSRGFSGNVYSLAGRRGHLACLTSKSKD